MFFQTRTYLDMPSYRSTKDRPRSFKMGKPPSDQSDYDGDRGPPDWSKYKWDDVPLENYPLMILFPTFDLPSIVLGTAPSNVIKIREAVLTIPRLQNVEVGTIDKGTTFAPVEIPIADFLRMLAKIAHGVAVAELGAASFTPLLNDIILGRSNFLGHYVGSPWFGKVRRNSNTLHRIYLEVRNGWLVAFVQLFAKYHAPCYCVVVGKPSASLLRWRLDGSSSAKFTDDAFDTRAVKFAVKIV